MRMPNRSAALGQSSPNVRATTVPRQEKPPLARTLSWSCQKVSCCEYPQLQLMPARLRGGLCYIRVLGDLHYKVTL